MKAFITICILSSVVTTFLISSLCNKFLKSKQKEDHVPVLSERTLIKFDMKSKKGWCSIVGDTSNKFICTTYYGASHAWINIKGDPKINYRSVGHIVENDLGWFSVQDNNGKILGYEYNQYGRDTMFGGITEIYVNTREAAWNLLVQAYDIQHRRSDSIYKLRNTWHIIE